MRGKTPVVTGVSGPAKSFLEFCRVEKGLAANSISSYRTDLERFISRVGGPVKDMGPEELGRYVASLYDAGMSPRSIARHVATLRNFYGFLAREGAIPRD